MNIDDFNNITTRRGGAAAAPLSLDSRRNAEKKTYRIQCTKFLFLIILLYGSSRNVKRCIFSDFIISEIITKKN